MVTMNEKRIILETVHGSRLYGLHHDQSDYDSYQVYVSPKQNAYRAKHKVKGLDDDFNVPLSKFMVMCNSGVPQALEALFSPYRKVAEEYEPFFNLYQVDVNEARMRYRRTVKSFAFTMENGQIAGPHEEFKKRRHAYRLLLNLNSLMEHGRFNSVLNDREIDYVNWGANLNDENHQQAIMKGLEQAQLGRFNF